MNTTNTTAVTTNYFLDTAPHFLLYFSVSAILAIAFLVIYQKITPHKEFELIREGKTAPAISLAGAFLGFTIPLGTVISNSVNLLDLILWSIVVLLVQVLVYYGVTRPFPQISSRITDDCVSSGVFIGGLSLGFGILNAACMVP